MRSPDHRRARGSGSPSPAPDRSPRSSTNRRSGGRSRSAPPGGSLRAPGSRGGPSGFPRPGSRLRAGRDDHVAPSGLCDGSGTAFASADADRKRACAGLDDEAVRKHRTERERRVAGHGRGQVVVDDVTCAGELLEPRERPRLPRQVLEPDQADGECVEVDAGERRDGRAGLRERQDRRRSPSTSSHRLQTPRRGSS